MLVKRITCYWVGNPGSRNHSPSSLKQTVASLHPKIFGPIPALINSGAHVGSYAHAVCARSGAGSHSQASLHGSLLIPRPLLRRTIMQSTSSGDGHGGGPGSGNGSRGLSLTSFGDGGGAGLPRWLILLGATILAAGKAESRSLFMKRGMPGVGQANVCRSCGRASGGAHSVAHGACQRSSARDEYHQHAWPYIN